MYVGVNVRRRAVTTYVLTNIRTRLCMHVLTYICAWYVRMQVGKYVVYVCTYSVGLRKYGGAYLRAYVGT